MFIRWRSRPTDTSHIVTIPAMNQLNVGTMNRRAQDRADRSVYHRQFDNYHDIKHYVHSAAAAGVPLTTTCVSCSNRSIETNEPNPLDYADRNLFSMSYPQGGGFPWLVADGKAHGQHMCFILPCGHLMGWSCMERHRNEAANRCPRCRTTWFRLDNTPAHCHHPIVVIPMRQSVVLSEEEEEWLVPPGGYVADKCRLCVTADSLRDLTIILRSQVPGDGSCSYATDGTVNGFLEGDDLKPFVNLDIAVEPPVIPDDLMEEARRMEGNIARSYEGRTPKAETRMVGAGVGRQFCFRVAGLARSPN